MPDLTLAKPLDQHGRFVFNGKVCEVRPILARDIETLRVWKNQNRQYFHHQEIISPEQQVRWFAAFQQDRQQQLFVCEIDQELVACVAFRIRTEDRVELFNLICGHAAYQGQGFVTQFFEFVRTGLARNGWREIELQVLKNNPTGLAWYLKRGFRQVDEGPTFLRLLLD